MTESATIAPALPTARAEFEQEAAAAPDLSRLDDPSAVAPADAKALSMSMLTRLRTLEEGTAEYSYVRATLVELNLSLVRYVAKRFRSSGEPMDDIVQVGAVGLIKAIDRFDPQRGLEFVTFAMPTMVGEIKRFFRDTTWAVHVPRRLQELRLTLARSRDQLEQELGRSVTVAELAAHLDIEEEEVIEGLAASNGHTAGSLDLRDEGDSEDTALVQRLGCPDPRMEKAENLAALKPMVAALDERDRLILHMRFVEELTQSEIGHELGVSQMHVSRLLTRVLTDMRAGLLADGD